MKKNRAELRSRTRLRGSFRWHGQESLSEGVTFEQPPEMKTQSCGEGCDFQVSGTASMRALRLDESCSRSSKDSVAGAYWERRAVVNDCDEKQTTEGHADFKRTWTLFRVWQGVGNPQ